MTTKKKATQRITNGRQDRFCLEYAMNGGNAAQAYVAAGYSKHGARQSAHRLLTNADVRQKIREYQREIHTKLMVEKEEVLRELAELAMFDPRRLFGVDGKLLAITEMDNSTAKSVQEMEVILDKEHCRTVKVKIGRDKLGALDKLMRFFSAYDDRSAEKTKPYKIYMMYKEDARA